MKEIVRKILESGLVDRHTALMLERWRTLEPGSADLVGQKKIETKVQLRQFAEEIEELLENEDEVMRETVLDLPIQLRHRFYDYATGGNFTALIDNTLRLVVSSKVALQRGQHLMDLDTGMKYQVADIEELYKDEQLCARRVLVYMETE